MSMRISSITPLIETIQMLVEICEEEELRPLLACNLMDMLAALIQLGYSPNLTVLQQQQQQQPPPQPQPQPQLQEQQQQQSITSLQRDWAVRALDTLLSMYVLFDFLFSFNVTTLTDKECETTLVSISNLW
jgi:outer membrane protein OmpA-like peptidoglycan-associated protein